MPRSVRGVAGKQLQLQSSLTLLQLGLGESTGGESVPVLEGEVDNLVQVFNVLGLEVGSPQGNVGEAEREVVELVAHWVLVEELGELGAAELRVQAAVLVETVDLGGNQSGVVLWRADGRTLGRDGDVSSWQGVVSQSGVGTQEVVRLDGRLGTGRDWQLGSELDQLLVVNVTNSNNGQVGGNKLLAQEGLEVRAFQSGQSVGLTVGWQGKRGSLECGGNHVLDDHGLMLVFKSLGKSRGLLSLLLDEAGVGHRRLQTAHQSLDGLEGLLGVTLGKRRDGQSGHLLGVGRADFHAGQRVGLSGGLGGRHNVTNQSRNTRVEWVFGSGTRVQVKPNRRGRLRAWLGSNGQAVGKLGDHRLGHASGRGKESS
ncbi:hypothetical protein OGAPHI_002163 [Ogataea philodendri]|uniref:Uncharacterized protein n=1 Tax=Ogataea philodendri TaxID=1378263 RepID=A0A9P8PBH4_9ASCO|nr:uncharacterized protein OGAPHI_002163 [Ogataea philodendri]KAH3668409.1 hypothetical protein OGAPHI_002163 [Ogataea philodendri]